MEEAASYIIYERKESLINITLNRPPLNILSIGMMNEINKVLSDLQFETEVKLIVLRTAGEIFSAGISIEEHSGELAFNVIDQFHRLFKLIHSLPVPVLAVVQGPALGGASELVAACDIAIAGEKAKFGQPEIKVGVFATIGAVIYPYLMGKKKTMELLLTGAIISANQAVELGLINRVVADNALEGEARKIADAILAHSSVAIQYTKQAILKSKLFDLDENIRAVEDLYLTELLKTQDAQEGIKAFLEKRKPQWVNK